MKGDNSKAVDFLQKFYPKGPYVLTYINPDKKDIGTATFDGSQGDQMDSWLESHNGQRNVYFSVAEPMRRTAKKMQRTDVKRVWYFHVDVDPRAGEDLREEQERALALCTTNLPEGVPKPTFVVFSGGGYQAFWRLKSPIEINGELEKAEDAKLYNIQLERLFGADNCHNIDRIMRLPGTVNIPDAKKRRRGRKPALAELIEYNEDAVYELSAFTKAQQVQSSAVSGLQGTSTAAISVEVGGNIRRLDSVEELGEWDVPDRVQAIIVQGDDELNPKKGDNSRSAWLFDVCCSLVRCEVPDEVIYSVITDPDFLISASVIDKGSNMRRYALRTIARAKEYGVDPILEEFNRRFAVIENWNGRCRVVEEVADEVFDGKPRLTKQSFEDFRNRFMNRLVQVGVTDKGKPVTKPAGKWWLENPARKQYHTVVFAPGSDVKESYNLWRGFQVEARPGDCSLYLDHVKKNICCGNEEYYEYLIGWMARAVQRPATAGQVAVVLRGGRGTGKGVFTKTFGHLFGRHFLQISNANHLVGNFNAHLRDAVVVFADEAFFAGDKKHESTLKTMVTEDTMMVEPKGVDSEMAPNYTHIIMASNNDWVVPAGGDERRYFVLDVGADQQQDTEYFKNILEQMKNGGYEALLHFLMTYDLSEYNVRDVPKTEALNEQKALSLTSEQEWWYRKLQEGALLPDHEHWNCEIVKTDIFEDYSSYAREFNIYHRGNQTTLGIFLGKVCPGVFPKNKRLIATRSYPTEDGYVTQTKKRMPHYIFPTLAECREQWESMFGPQAWEQEPEQAQIDEGEIPF